MLAHIASAATIYVGPSATGNGLGGDADNLMAWATWKGSSRTSDTCYFGADMTSVISEDFYWPTCLGYYAKYVQVYATYSVGFRFADYERIFQWAAGDIGVVDPEAGVSVTALVPSPTTAVINSATVDVHGTMIDPVSGWKQGIHGSIGGYDATYNEGPDIAGGTPYTLTAGHTMVHTYGQTTADGNAEYIMNAAALHCVASVPEALSFRPTYAGGSASKTIFLASAVDTQITAGRLASVAAPDGAPTYSGLATQARPLWLELIAGGANGRSCHPKGPNRGQYGASLSGAYAQMALWTNTNQTASEKKFIAYCLVQAGIDAWGFIKSSDVGRRVLDPENGAHGQSKMRFAYAGWLLDDATILAGLEKTGDHVRYSASSTSVATDFIHTTEEQVYKITANDILEPPYPVGYAGWGSMTGTVSVEHGSTAVVGSGTNWASIDDHYNNMISLRDASNIAVDDQATSLTKHAYAIASITDNTHLTLSEAYTGDTASGQLYVMAGGIVLGHGSAVARQYKTDEPIIKEYTAEDVGVSVWGITWGSPAFEHPTASPYGEGWYSGSLGSFEHRYQPYWVQSYCGHQLAAMMMGMADIWNHDAAFEFTDRLVTVNGNVGMSYAWTYAMWDAYRADYDPAPWEPKCHTPVPSNSATDIATSQVLSWYDGNGRVPGSSCNVYFGTDSTPDATELVDEESTDYAYTPELAAGTTYYWRVDEVCSGGTYAGDVWSFTTEGGEEPHAETKHLLLLKD